MLSDAGRVKSSQIVQGQAAGRGVPVVNENVTFGVALLPARSFTASVTLYVVAAANAALGWKLAVSPSLDTLDVPATVAPAAVMTVYTTDAGSIFSSNVA